MATKLVRLVEIKQYLGLEDDDSDDEIIQDIENAVADFVEEYTGRHFGSIQTFQNVINGTGTRVIWLENEPTSFTSVEERDSPDTSTWDTVDSTDYEVHGRKLFNLEGDWKRGRLNYRVNYDAGYNKEDLPSQIRLAIKELVAWKYRKIGKEGIRRERIGDYSYTVADVQSANAESDFDIFSMLNQKKTIFVG